jgi:hypothetical protein
MLTNRKLKPEEAAFTQSVHAVFLREVDLSFEDAVREYRRVEAEFVERAGDEEWDILETKRRISEWLLRLALRAEQPHEVCREIWEELVQRGFSNDQQKHIFSAIYARCCQQNGEFDAGITVIEPLIIEIEGQLQSTTLDPEVRVLYTQLLPTHRKIRDELKAGVRE